MVRIARLISILGLGAALLGGAAFGQAAQPEGQEGRFTFFHTSDGFLRLDGESGQVSLCTSREAGWICQVLPEERAALEAEITRLQGEDAALKKQVLSHGLPLPDRVRPDAPTAESQPPGVAEHGGKEIMSLLENVWHRLVAMVVSVQRDLLERS